MPLSWHPSRSRGAHLCPQQSVGPCTLSLLGPFFPGVTLWFSDGVVLGGCLVLRGGQNKGRTIELTGFLFVFMAVQLVCPL